MNRYLMAVALLSSIALAAFVAHVQGSPHSENRQSVPAFAAKDFCIVFRGGETGNVTLRGTRDTDLVLYILDETGHLVTGDDDCMGNCLASWYVPQTRQYTVRVVNRGSVCNEFDLLTD